MMSTKNDLSSRGNGHFYEQYKAKILLKFYYLEGILKLQVMGSITW